MQGQLALEGLPEKLVRVTPARLSTWEQCPRKYRMAYVDQPSPSRAGASASSTLGAVVHNALRAFFELPAEQRTAGRAAALVRQYWRSEGFSGPEQAAAHRARAQEWVQAYVEQLEPGFAPVAVERWVSAPVGTIIAEGRVDRIDDRDGQLVVVDYKTGRSGVRSVDAGKSLALALYALAVSHHMRRPCRRVELHHLPTGATVGWDHSEQSLADLRSKAERLAAELQAATDAFQAETTEVGEAMFPARPGKRCAFCEFRQHCPEGQQAAPETAPWASLEDL